MIRMHRVSLAGLFAIASLVVMGACGEDTPPPEILSVEVTPSTVAPGGTVNVAVELAHFEFTEEHEDHEAPKHGEGGDNVGHIHVYLDDLMTNPLAMPIEAAFDVTVPADTELGAHTLILRLHDADHLIIEPEVTADAAITVE